MALNPLLAFVGRITAATTQYPYGSSKNESSPGAGDGTPYNLTRANDIFGLQQALLKACGITPNGNPDEVGTSEYLQAVVEEAQGRAKYVIEDTGSVAGAYVLTANTDNEIARSFFEGMELAFTPAAANSGATTIDPFGLGATSVRSANGLALTGGEIRTDALNRVRYDAINGWFILLRPVDIGDKALNGVTASVAGNALTITKSADIVDFRSGTLTDGTPVTRIIPSDITLTISSGSTLGTIAGNDEWITILEIDNAGTVELAAVNLSGGLSLDETGLISTTAEGGAGGADSNNVIYSTTARTNVAYRVAALIKINEAVPGTWATGPILVQPAGGNAATAMQSLGYGQTWQDVTASRAIGTTYYNTTGRPIEIAVHVTTNAGVNSLLIINGVTVGRIAGETGTGENNTLAVTVPPGASYQVSGGTSLLAWVELR